MNKQLDGIGRLNRLIVKNLNKHKKKAFKRMEENAKKEQVLHKHRSAILMLTWEKNADSHAIGQLKKLNKKIENFPICSTKDGKSYIHMHKDGHLARGDTGVVVEKAEKLFANEVLRELFKDSSELDPDRTQDHLISMANAIKSRQLHTSDNPSIPIFNYYASNFGYYEAPRRCRLPWWGDDADAFGGIEVLKERLNLWHVLNTSLIKIIELNKGVPIQFKVNDVTATIDKYGLHHNPLIFPAVGTLDFFRKIEPDLCQLIKTQQDFIQDNNLDANPFLEGDGSILLLSTDADDYIIANVKQERHKLSTLQSELNDVKKELEVIKIKQAITLKESIHKLASQIKSAEEAYRTWLRTGEDQDEEIYRLKEGHMYKQLESTKVHHAECNDALLKCLGDAQLDNLPIRNALKESIKTSSDERDAMLQRVIKEHVLKNDIALKQKALETLGKALEEAQKAMPPDAQEVGDTMINITIATRHLEDINEELEELYKLDEEYADKYNLPNKRKDARLRQEKEDKDQEDKNKLDKDKATQDQLDKAKADKAKADQLKKQQEALSTKTDARGVTDRISSHITALELLYKEQGDLQVKVVNDIQIVANLKSDTSKKKELSAAKVTQSENIKALAAKDLEIKEKQAAILDDRTKLKGIFDKCTTVDELNIITGTIKDRETQILAITQKADTAGALDGGELEKAEAALKILRDALDALDKKNPEDLLMKESKTQEIQFQEKKVRDIQENLALYQSELRELKDCAKSMSDKIKAADDLKKAAEDLKKVQEDERKKAEDDEERKRPKEDGTPPTKYDEDAEDAEYDNMYHPDSDEMEREKFQIALNNLLNNNENLKALSLKEIQGIFDDAARSYGYTLEGLPADNNPLKIAFSVEFQQECAHAGLMFSNTNNINKNGMRTKSAKAFVKENKIDLEDALKKAGWDK